ncbi:metal homeostatis protein bsd2 [Halteromyces radiatus]|uniref:metal homeostatis protein bsd2 n=1 Tax=Halteromyces radiatus TaxID=101107 RepID=UPI00221EF4B2|nr:metal homeostatis protein bsd2 [Halteromyces radiatus]KAI8084585.1 metal homeostatis protein bsd2 [Halteromyces radiatus]
MPKYQQVSTTANDEQIESNHSSYNSSNSSPTTSQRSNSAHFSTTQQQRQQTDLEDTFGESFEADEEDDDDIHHDEGRRLLHSSSSSSRSPPNISSQQIQQQPAVLSMNSTNDGVFSNMSAKPESDSAKVDETPPAYDVAIADATPPYWQTTVIAPLGMGDVILVEGLPVGSLLGFAWNLLVSASFQFVGFMLTYLLHTSHAAKNGSLAGLGVSLVQTGFYIRSRESLVDDPDMDDNNGKHGDHSGEDYDGKFDADIISYILMIIGWFLIIRSIADYTRAKKMESIIGQEPTPETIV